MDELWEFMEVAKLQTPRVRSKKEIATYPKKTVKHEEDGSVHITKVEIKPKSSGRERFGERTRNWKRFPLNTPCLKTKYC